MKKVVLVTMFLVGCVGVNAQCKYDKDEVDEFTANKIISTKSETLGKSAFSFVSVSFSMVDSFLYLHAKVSGRAFECVTKKSELYIKLSDGTVEVFQHVGDIDCENSDYIPKSFVSLMTKKQLELFTEVNVESIRILVSNGKKDYKVKEKRRRKFMDLARCMQVRL